MTNKTVLAFLDVRQQINVDFRVKEPEKHRQQNWCSVKKTLRTKWTDIMQQRKL